MRNICYNQTNEKAKGSENFFQIVKFDGKKVEEKEKYPHAKAKA